MKLRPRQAAALERSKQRYEQGINRQLIVLPTGMGKTVVFANLLQHHELRGRMLIIVHREELAQQAREKIEHWNPGYTVGIEMGNRVSSPADRVVVGSVQTLGGENNRRLQQFRAEDFSAVVVDEAHHAVAASYRGIFSHFGLLGDGTETSRLLLGVTATTGRGDGQGLVQVFDEIVYECSLLDAIKEGWLCRVRGWQLRTKTNLDGVPVLAGDFNQGQLSAAVNVKQRNAQIAAEWIKNASGKQTIAFAVDIRHAQDLAEAFSSRGVAAAAVWGNDPDRRQKLAAHRAREIQVLCNCGVLTEGYDDWQVECIVLARPTKSKLLLMQMAGRGTRLPEGVANLKDALAQGVEVVKQDCVLIDVTDTTKKHSLCTISSIFGMPTKMDLHGRDVVQCAEIFDSACMTKPELDLSGCEDIDRLNTYLEEVDLFTVKFAPEVVENSEYQWHTTPLGNYVLVLPKGERVSIAKNILNHWVVEGCVEGSSFMDYCETREDAFRWADSLIKMFGRKLISMLRRVPNKAVSKSPITTAQQQAITTRLGALSRPLPNFAVMSKHDAALLLGKLYAR